MPKTKTTVTTLVMLSLMVAWPQSYIIAQNPAPTENSSTESIVIVPYEQKQEFLQANGLNNQILQPVSTLKNTYIVPVTTDKLKKTNKNVQVAPRRKYKALLTPNDSIYPQYYTDKISAPAAWDISTGSASVSVAVIDTGFALDHEDLAGRWHTNGNETGTTLAQGPAPNCTSRLLLINKDCNNLDDDGNGFVDDWRGWDFFNIDNNPSAGSVNPNGEGVSHGTNTAGLIGATGNNNKGVAAVNWQSKILPLQILDDDGSGYTEDLVAAINYAVARQVKVINISLGSTGNDPLVEQAINNAVGSGIIVVAAAGNCGDTDFAAQGCSTQGQILYPAKYSNTVAVGATDANDVRASFSSYGPEIDLMAPGSGVIKTPSWLASNPTTAYTNTAFGTSFSAPIVAGSAASILSLNPSFTPAQVRQAVLTTTDKVAGMNSQNFTNEYGYGRLNILLALSAQTGEARQIVHRLYNPKTYMHLWTTTQADIDAAIRYGGYSYEGIAFYVPTANTPGAVLVHRLYNPKTFVHFWTITQADIDAAIRYGGYSYEGVAYSALPTTNPPAGSVAIHRLYNPKTYLHLWTAHQADIDNAIKNAGYHYEGVAYYGYLTGE